MDVQKENQTLSAQVSELQRQVKSLQTAPTSSSQGTTVEVAVRAAVEEAVSEAAQVEQKKLKLRLTRLPAGVRSQADADALVTELMQVLQVSVQPVSVTLHKVSYSAVAAGKAPAVDKTGSISVSVGSIQDKIDILLARKKLQSCDKFRSMGVNEDLTKKQQALKSAAWPAFKAARAEGKRAYFKAEKLMINGEAYTLPTPAPSPTSSAAVAAAAPVGTPTSLPASNTT